MGKCGLSHRMLIASWTGALLLTAATFADTENRASASGPTAESPTVGSEQSEDTASPLVSRPGACRRRGGTPGEGVLTEAGRRVRHC